MQNKKATSVAAVDPHPMIPSPNQVRIFVYAKGFYRIIKINVLIELCIKEKN